MLPTNIKSRAVLEKWVGTITGEAEFMANTTLSKPTLLVEWILSETGSSLRWNTGMD